MKIMLLEDDVALNDTICDILSQLKECEVDAYYDGESAYKNIGNMYNLFILDINVPHIDGLELLQYLSQSYTNTPAIIISADTNIKTITKAYTNGCHDFLKKPFHVQELLFKVKQQMKINDSIDLGDGLVYNLHNKTLHKDDKEVYLTKKEREMLYLFVINRNEIVSSQMIQNFVYQDKFVSSDSLRALVKRVRKVIGKDKIVNLPSQGYRLLS
ncbi:MAG: response regulator transcription factor [Campylobacterota bacterium]